MQTIRMTKKTEADGSLSLHIPLGKPETQFEVVVIVQPSEPGGSLEARGWPPGDFDRTCGSINDDTFIRHPQVELPKPVTLD
jgi:hypothetical protein